MAGWRLAARLAPVVLALAGLGAASPAQAQAVPSFEAVRAAHRPSDIALLDRHGVHLQWQRIEAQVRRGPA